jgi:hypothetical protein
LLGRLISASAALTAAGAVYLSMGRGFDAWSAALGVAALGALAWRYRPVGPGRTTAVSVDAGGNWALAGVHGWSRFTPERICISPLGWMSMQGTLRPLGAVPPQVVSSGATRVRQFRQPHQASFTIWFDSVSPAEWRSLRVAAYWSMQRNDPLLVSHAARDPRLEHPV